MMHEGAIAQLGERCNRTAEVVSSNLIGSTIQIKDLPAMARTREQQKTAIDLQVNQ